MVSIELLGNRWPVLESNQKADNSFAFIESATPHNLTVEADENEIDRMFYDPTFQSESPQREMLSLLESLSEVWQTISHSTHSQRTAIGVLSNAKAIDVRENGKWQEAQLTSTGIRWKKCLKEASEFDRPKWNAFVLKMARDANRNVGEGNYDRSECHDCQSQQGKLLDLFVAIHASGDSPDRIHEWPMIRALLRDAFGPDRTIEELWELMTDRLRVNGWDEERWLRTKYGEFIELLKSGLLSGDSGTKQLTKTGTDASGSTDTNTAPEKQDEVDDKLPKKLRKDSPSRVKAKSAYDYAMERISIHLAGDHARAGRHVARLLYTIAKRRYRELRSLVEIVTQ